MSIVKSVKRLSVKYFVSDQFELLHHYRELLCNQTGMSVLYI